MSEKADTEPEVDNGAVDKSGDELVNKPEDETVDKLGDEETVDKVEDAATDEHRENQDDGPGVKLPPLVKSGSAKYSDKTVSSKSSAGSFYLKSPKYSIWGQSNVDSVLTDYGYPPGNTPTQNSAKQARQSTGKKSFSFDGSDLVKEQDTRESRKQYYLKIYEDIHKLRDYCRDDYFEKLEEKVGKQRKDMKKKCVVFLHPSGSSSMSPGEEDEEEGDTGKMPNIPLIINSESNLGEIHTSSVQLMMNWLKDIENHANKTPVIAEKPHAPQKKYYVSKIYRKPKRDIFLARNYLKNVPKSEHYKIIQLEEKLRAEGKLKTQADVDEFWCTIRRPDVFKKYFLVSEQRTFPYTNASLVPTTMVATLSNPILQAAKADPPPSLKPFDKIMEYWQSPAIVNIRDKAGHTTSLGKRTKSPVLPVATVQKEDDPFHLARKAAAELDQKHPQMVIPHLNCFYMDLEEKQADPEEALRELRSIKHSKERLLFVKRLHRMYSLANANLASTQRILEKRQELELDPFHAGCSVVSDLIPERVLHSTPEMRALEHLESRPWLKYIERKREITPIQEVSEGETGGRESITSGIKSDKGTSGDRSVRVYGQETVPICWKSLVHDKDVKVLDSKTPNFYWVNYMEAGKKIVIQ